MLRAADDAGHELSPHVHDLCHGADGSPRSSAPPSPPGDSAPASCPRPFRYRSIPLRAGLRSRPAPAGRSGKHCSGTYRGRRKGDRRRLFDAERSRLHRLDAARSTQQEGSRSLLRHDGSCSVRDACLSVRTDRSGQGRSDDPGRPRTIYAGGVARRLCGYSRRCPRKRLFSTVDEVPAAGHLRLSEEEASIAGRSREGTFRDGLLAPGLVRIHARDRRPLRRGSRRSTQMDLSRLRPSGQRAEACAEGDQHLWVVTRFLREGFRR